jgi:hypothetical protein
LVSATVNLVDGSATASFTLGADTVDIWGIDVRGGALAGLDTFPIGPGVVSDNSDTALNGSWWIQWWDGVYSLDYGVGQETLINTVSLEKGETAPCGATPFVNGVQCSGVVSTALTVTFTQTTPEPGSLGLLLGALGAGWWARRRKDVA